MTKKTIIVIVAVVVGLGLIGAANPQPKTKAPVAAQTTVKKEEPVKSTADQRFNLAERVQQAYLGNIGYKTIAELNLDADNLVGQPENEIVSFTDVRAGQVQVKVQDNLTKQQATTIAMSVAASAVNVKDLHTVFVEGINGTSSYAGKPVN